MDGELEGTWSTSPHPSAFAAAPSSLPPLLHLHLNAKATSSQTAARTLNLSLARAKRISLFLCTPHDLWHNYLWQIDLKCSCRKRNRNVSLGLLGVVVLQTPGLPGWSWSCGLQLPGLLHVPTAQAQSPMPGGGGYIVSIVSLGLCVCTFLRTWKWEWKAWQMNKKSCANWKALKRSGKWNFAAPSLSPPKLPKSLTAGEGC